MDAISRGIVESAGNPDGATALHSVFIVEDGEEAFSFITSGELAQLQRHGFVEWDDEVNAYVLTGEAKEAL